MAVEVVDGAPVVEAEVGLADADAEILLVGVAVVHLALLVGEEGLEVDMVGFRATQHSSLIAYLGVGIDGEEVEIGFAAQGCHLAGGTHALDDAVAARSMCLLVELLNDP